MTFLAGKEEKNEKELGLANTHFHQFYCFFLFVCLFFVVVVSLLLAAFSMNFSLFI